MRHPGRQDHPRYITGRRGPNWTRSLRVAQERGAVIVVEDSGIAVAYSPHPSAIQRTLMWLDGDGNRYESRDCVPVF